jgi:hypothetical protein
MDDWRDVNLGKDETVLNTFKGGLEFMGTDKAISGILILTNQKISFLKKGRDNIFSAFYSDMLSTRIGRTRHPSLSIWLKHGENLRFFTGKKGDVRKLCTLIHRQMSVEKKEKSRMPPQDQPFVKEIIKEKEVIVKIRCPYCNGLYNEIRNRCPHCNGSR